MSFDFLIHNLLGWDMKSSLDPDHHTVMRLFNTVVTDSMDKRASVHVGPLKTHIHFDHTIVSALLVAKGPNFSSGGKLRLDVHINLNIGCTYSHANLYLLLDCLSIIPKKLCYCKSGNFRENFIFANSIKRHICDVKNLRLGNDLPTSVNAKVISSFHKEFIFKKLRLHICENKTLAKMHDT